MALLLNYVSAYPLAAAAIQAAAIEPHAPTPVSPPVDGCEAQAALHEIGMGTQPPISGAYPVASVHSMAAGSPALVEHPRLVHIGGMPFFLGDVISPPTKGGLSTVYRAWDPTSQQWVIVKVYHPSASQSKELLQKRVEMESRRHEKAQKAGITNIPRIHAISSERDENACLVMNEIFGWNLNRLSSESRLKFKFPKKSLASKVIAIVADLYRKARILHRDLKPPQFMVDDKGSIFILDLGSSLDLDNPEDGKGIRSGATEGYMAPEMYGGSGAQEEAYLVHQEVFALGVLLYYLYSGKTMRPADGQYVARVPSINGVSAGINDILQRMLSREPQNRPSLAQVQEVFSDEGNRGIVPAA